MITVRELLHAYRKDRLLSGAELEALPGIGTRFAAVRSATPASRATTPLGKASTIVMPFDSPPMIDLMVAPIWETMLRERTFRDCRVDASAAVGGYAKSASSAE